MNRQITRTRTIDQVSAVADRLSAAAAFDEYRAARPQSTLNRQAGELRRFADYLRAKHVDVGELATDPKAWNGITFGLVNGFKLAMLADGFAVDTVNVTLAMIRTVSGIPPKDARNIDGNRKRTRRTSKTVHTKDGIRVRRTTKKATSNTLNADQVKNLKETCDVSTPAGRRDAVLLALLADLGLRVGEVVGLEVGAVDLVARTLTFERPKVDKIQTHALRNGTYAAIAAYMPDAPAAGPMSAPLLRSTDKTGKYTHAGMTRFGIAKRLQVLGERIGISNLSPHDLRHSWATRAAANETSAFALRDAGGWSTLAMPSLYVAAAEIANAGVKLGDDDDG